MDREKQAKEFQRVLEGGMNDYNRRLLSFLSERKMLFPSARVIDIGCGVGKYAAYFASIGCDLTLVDISEPMLSRAENNLRGFNVPLRAMLGDFNAISENELTLFGKFDLSVSTMSPAVHDFKTVQKLSRITDGYCFVTDFVSWNQPVRDKFYSLLGLNANPRSGLNERMVAIYNAVIQAGFKPEVRREPYSWSDKRAPADAAEFFLSRHKSPEASDPALLKKAVDAASRLSGSDGMVDDRVDAEVAWLFWRTD